jgi:uncharacterized protein YbbC (DUF1343 family)/CubicO group peptidase (beta-lactamase class C family)
MKCVSLLFCAAFALSAQNFEGAADADAAIQQAIREKKIPGAVLVVGHAGKVIYRKAYGSRALVPAEEPMSLDTIFDVASLTKVVATTPSVMKLFEQGKIRITAKVTDYLPEFQDGHSDITIQQLMTHFSGLKPDVELVPAWTGYQTGIDKALHDPPANPPGAKFVYSDINFILMGEIMRRVSGQTLPEFAHANIYAPLHMDDTMYQPPASLKPRIAPTERQKDGEILRGVVHDPTARYMGGVAGHAGLFSTGDDLARYCQMMLDLGAGLFNPATVMKFTSPATAPHQPVLRGLGWDIDSPYSGNRGELFPAGKSYGHTGFTGTSIWIDPGSQTYVILLTNAVHPAAGKSITALRGRVATIVAAAVGREKRSSAAITPVLTGLDVLAARNFSELQGKRVGLITNPTGIDRERRRNIDLMLEHGVKLTSLYSPEHGFLGAADQENVKGMVDPKTGLHIYSLYEGKNRRPSQESLKALDAMVFDIADVGARFYTYVTTMAYAMEECAKAKVPIYVLDRPNPVTGTHVEGPMLDPSLTSFIGYFPVPLRHGMTVGELARMFNEERHIGADLHVIQMEGWRRTEWFDETGLPWVDLSPNMRNLNEALLYPGIGMLEYSTNWSVGRGTDSPFEVVGAEFVNGEKLSAYLSARAIPGVRFYPVRFTPTASHLTGKPLEGVRFVVTDRDVFDSTRLGAELAAALQKLYPGKIDFTVNKTLIGSAAFTRGLADGKDPEALLKAEPLDKFLAIREKYLLYR